MSGLHLGAGLDLPLDAVTRTTAIVGQRGTGKTSTAVVVVEEASKAGAQFAVIDPTGAWYGLRSSASGKGPGLSVVVFGGHHADLPLEATAGSFLAKLVVEQQLNVVLDLELLTKAKQVQFVAEFAAELYHTNRTALTLVIDEAHRFAPQQLRDPGGFGARCLGAVTDVVALGRRKGLGAVLISQRPATINKDVFEQAEILIAHRLMGPNDQKAIAGWLAEVGTVDHPLDVRSLARGQAVVYAPAYEIAGAYRLRKKETFDSSATPEVGASTIEPKGRADVDLESIREAMAETIERAQADDPKKLRARIRELERQVAAPAPTEREVVEVEVPTMPGWLLQRVIDLEGIHRTIVSQTGHLADDLQLLRSAVEEHTSEPRSLPRDPETRRIPAPRPTPARAATSGDGPAVKAGARRMLEAVASLHPMPLTRAQVGTLAKVKRTGGTYSTYLGVLKQHGYLVEEGDRLTITDAGFAALGTSPAAPASADELRDLWRDRLKAGARRMLDILIERHPEALTRAELADAAEVAVTGGTFSTYLGMLRTAGLIDESDGGIRAGDVLFLGARA